MFCFYQIKQFNNFIIVNCQIYWCMYVWCFYSIKMQVFFVIIMWLLVVDIVNVVFDYCLYQCVVVNLLYIGKGFDIMFIFKDSNGIVEGKYFFYMVRNV